MNPRQVAMAKLRGYRSYGGSEERVSMYLNHREMKKVFTADLIEAVERLAITGKGTSFPSLSEVLTACRGAFTDRRRHEQFNDEQGASYHGRGPMIKDMSPQERETLIADFRAMRKRYVKSFDMEKPAECPF